MTTSSTIGRRRWTIGVLLGVGILINYFDRVNISVAGPQLQEEFGLTPGDLGLLFSAFFWSYAILQAPVGWSIPSLIAPRGGMGTIGGGDELLQ
jgi:sugar phosphate permease